MDLLKQLYFIHAPSGHEHGMQGFLRHHLTGMGLNFKVDGFNQTYNLSHPGQPVIVAHTDQVGRHPVTIITETKTLIRGNANLGADDKNGIWIALKILEVHPGINFIFSTSEEIGGNIQNLIDVENMNDKPFAIVFDRKEKKDIIGEKNMYCSKEFEDEIAILGAPFGYRPVAGVWSDCDHIAPYINTVNLSCGYYAAHTEREYTNKNDLVNALAFGLAIFESDLKAKEILPNMGILDYMDDDDDLEDWSLYDDDKWDYYRKNDGTWERYIDDVVVHDVCPNCGSVMTSYVSGGDGTSGQICPACQYTEID